MAKSSSQFSIFLRGSVIELISMVMSLNLLLEVSDFVSVSFPSLGFLNKRTEKDMEK